MADTPQKAKPKATGKDLGHYDEFLVSSVKRTVRSKIRGVPDSSEVIGIIVSRKMRTKVKLLPEIAKSLNNQRPYMDGTEFLWLFPTNTVRNGDELKAKETEEETTPGYFVNRLEIIVPVKEKEPAA